jgi:inosine/xanthosine triphosphatase
MNIGIGSENPDKIRAVLDSISYHRCFDKSNVYFLEVESGVRKQPLCEQEIYFGAQNRAKNVYESLESEFGIKIDLGIGIESGIKRVPLSRYEDIRYYDITSCVIYDGYYTYKGESTSITIPSEIVWGILNEGFDLDEAAKSSGWTKINNIGREGGIVKILTKGKINRKKYTENSVDAALAHLLNSSLGRKIQQ